MIFLKNKYKFELLNLLRKIDADSSISQRKLAKELGYSIGKLNYIINNLKLKGILKIKNFRENKKKFKYFYLLTPKGVAEKTKITIQYIKIISNEYDNIKKEIKKNKLF